MPWTTPSLRQVRSTNRDYIVSRSKLPIIPNSVTRAVSDASGGLAHGVYQYIDWLALQLMADTCETEWLDRQGNIWLQNADGSRGRKGATQAVGTLAATGAIGTLVPVGTQFAAGVGTSTSTILLQSTDDITIGDAPTGTIIPVVSIDAGVIGDLSPGDAVALVRVIDGVSSQITVVSMDGGTEQETDDELRARVLQRIQKPPMGGDADDFVTWGLSYPGVTRAWCSPREMGIGTVTLRFMMDDLRAAADGFPNAEDVLKVQAWIDSLRPVTALDTFVLSPLRQPVSCRITHLDSNDSSTRANIAAAIQGMIFQKAAPAYAVDGIPYPAQTIFAEWVSAATSSAVGVESFDFFMSDQVMPSPGHMGVLGNVVIDP